MFRTIAWYTVVVGYAIQTKGFSIIQSDKFLSLDSIRRGGHLNVSKITMDQMKSAMTFYLTSTNFVALMLILPIAAFLRKEPGSSNLNEFNFQPLNSNGSEEYELQDLPSENGNDNGDRCIEGRSLSMDLSLDISNLISHEGTAPSPSSSLSSSSSSTHLNSNSNFTTFLPSHTTIFQTLRDIVGCIIPSHSFGYTAAYITKLVVLSSLLVIPVFTYMLALSLSPAFDVALIQNTSIFEIVTLLYGVCGISKRKYIFRNFLVMCAALLGILIISYTKATCDILAGKLSINPTTGEISDPFLFDRLKASLLCGLGNLPVGLFAVMWNSWFGQRSNTIQQQSAHLSLIGIISLAMLVPFGPGFKVFYECIQLFNGDGLFWSTLLGSVFLGTVPFFCALLYLNRISSPEYLTTCNLGSIISMGIMEWLAEPTQTTIVRWEVVGYIMLSLSCLFLSMILV
ncbi:mannosylinositol phosphorylceramide synthase regulatory subunit PWA37_003482 [Arxiozyma heterogenica]|uniref:mannosylinositol phosphorylceramide synthase regulatory subunit n=1 Tax=Arxiozyma heterogenica TaxID=278026 RepID=UPI002EDD8DFC